MLDVRHHLSPGCSIGAQLVGDHALRRDALLLQQPRQQALGRFGVAAVLDDLVEHIAILVDGAPQPVFPAGDGDDDLVQVRIVTSELPQLGKYSRLQLSLAWPAAKSSMISCSLYCKLRNICRVDAPYFSGGTGE